MTEPPYLPPDAVEPVPYTGRRRRHQIPASRKALAMLEAIDKKNGPFICFNCNKNYKYYCDLARHVKFECVDRVKNYACNLCHKRYYRSSHLSVHMQKHGKQRGSAQKSVKVESTNNLDLFDEELPYSNISGLDLTQDDSCTMDPQMFCEPEIELGDYELQEGS